MSDPNRNSPPANQPTLILEIPLLPTAPNLNSRTHWRVRQKETLAGHETIAAALAQLHPRPEPGIVPVEVHFQFHLPTRRRRDLDNLLAGCKPWLDGLTHCAIIPDDSTEWLRRLSCGSDYAPAHPGTTLTIRPWRGTTA